MISTMLNSSQKVFNKRKIYAKDYIKWQYADHPSVPVLGYDAIYQNEIGGPLPYIWA